MNIQWMMNDIITKVFLMDSFVYIHYSLIGFLDQKCVLES